MRGPATVLASLLLGLGISNVAEAAPPTDLDAYAQRALKSFDTPGMTLAIVEGSSVTTRGYGLRKLGDPAPVDTHTVFPINSNSKAVTAAALAMLVDEGKLSWDDKVRDRLPGFGLIDPVASQQMTVRDLLVHNSGLGLGAGDLLFVPPTRYPRSEVVKRLHHVPFAAEFRSAYAYDNLLYVAAGELVEAVSGLSWEDFLEQRMFKPLGMTDTSPSARRTTRANRAWEHTRVEPNTTLPMRFLPLETDDDLSAPAGGIEASATDLAKWIQVLLDRGALPGGGRLYSEAAAAEMWTPRTLMPIDPDEATLPIASPTMQAYALGWDVRDYRGHQVFMHTGAGLGSKSVVVIIPEKHVGFGLAINADEGGARWAVAYRLLDHYLGLTSPDWIAAAVDKRAKSIAGAKAAQAEAAAKAEQALGAGGPTKPSSPLSSYVGVYSDPWYGTVSVTRSGEGLAFRLDPARNAQGPLEHVRQDTFRTRFTDRSIEDAYVTFSFKPDGTVERVKMQAVSPLADFSFDYQDLLLTPVAKP
jgi:CubicO group peptidase (beta-lactamase class C family)